MTHWSLAFKRSNGVIEFVYLRKSFGKTTVELESEDPIPKEAVEEIMADSSIPDDVKATAMRLYMENIDVSV